MTVYIEFGIIRLYSLETNVEGGGVSLGDLRAGSFFNGVINEVALFNIALSDADIRTLMQGLAVSMTAVKLSGNLAIT